MGKRLRTSDRSTRVSVSTVSAVLVLSLLVAIPWHLPPVSAGSLVHSNAVIGLTPTDQGDFHDLFWNSVRQTAYDGASDWMGLVIDHDGYDHTAADGDGTFISDVIDGDLSSTTTPIFWEANSAAKMQSLGAYHHGSTDPADVSPPISEVEDVNVTQRVITLQGKSWAVLEYGIYNNKSTPMTNLYVGLYMAVSHRQGPNDFGGLGGTARDETDGWDATSKAAFFEDGASATVMAISSALPGMPLTQHYVDDNQAFFQPNDDLLFTASNNNQVVGVVAGNRYVLTGFDVGTLAPGETAVLPFIIAFNTTLMDVLVTDIPDAQSFYFLETLPVMLTEFRNEPTPRVEIYNDWDSPVDISGWTLASSMGTIFTIPPLTTVPAKSYYTADTTGFSTEADVIALRTGSGVEVDRVAFGWMGSAPDPVSGLSTARIWDATPMSYSDDWTMAVIPGDVSFGSQNPVPPIDNVPYLVLNEVSFNPSGGCGAYVETRYVRTTGSIDFTVTNYYLAADALYTIGNGMVDTTNLFRIVDAADYPVGFDIDAGADNVYLFDDQGRLLDMVGWSGGHGVDTSAARKPEGNGTHYGYDDATSVAAGWRFESTPTYARHVAVEYDGQAGGDAGTFVNYSLTLYNYQAIPDVVDFVVTTEAGWPVSLYDASWLALGDSNTNGLPDVSATAGSTTPLWASVEIPGVSSGDFENTTVGVLSENHAAECPAGYDEAVLSTQVYPHLEVSKWANPNVIDQAGTGPNDVANVTVQVTGGGVPQIEFFHQDTVFLVDSSGSMAWNDPGNLRLEALDLYMQDMTADDWGAIVAFGHDYDLVPSPLYTCEWVPPFWMWIPWEPFLPTGWLTDNMSTPSSPGQTIHHLTSMDAAGLAALQGDLATIGPPDHPPIFFDPNCGIIGPATNIEHAMQFAHEELIPGYTSDPTTTYLYNNGVPEVGGRTFPSPGGKGVPGHIWVEILITDGLPTHPTIATMDEVLTASLNGVRIFTIGLLGNVSGNARLVAEAYLRSIADQTGGKYFFADKPEDLAGVYQEIGTEVRDIAAIDPDPSDPSVAMINDVLPDYVELVPGSISVTSGTFSTVPTTCVSGQQCTIRWKLSSVNVGQMENMTYQVRSSRIGLQNITQQPDSAVKYSNWNGTVVNLAMPDAWLTVVGPVPDVEPPLVTSLTALGGDVTVGWQPSPSTNVDFYEIFGGPAPTNISFATPLGITADGAAVSWTHVGGAAEDEFYYVVRAVNVTGAKNSVTSNTAGFVAVDFAAGVNSFSLPLEPFADAPASWYESDMGASWILWMDSGGAWRDTTFSDPYLEVGKGYVVSMQSAARYLFTGEPGAMIVHRDGWGFDASGRLSLTASVDAARNVVLSWDPVSGVDYYTILRSSTRRGFHDSTAIDITPFGPPVESYVDLGGAAGDGARYYMVIPFSAANGGNGSSTYSIGVWTHTFRGHESLGLPLRPRLADPGTVDELCEAFPGALGMMFLKDGLWVGHFREMPAGVFDAPVAQARGYQVTVATGAGPYSFIGW